MHTCCCASNSCIRSLAGYHTQLYRCWMNFSNIRSYHNADSWLGYFPQLQCDIFNLGYGVASSRRIGESVYCECETWKFGNFDVDDRRLLYFIVRVVIKENFFSSLFVVDLIVYQYTHVIMCRDHRLSRRKELNCLPAKFDVDLSNMNCLGYRSCSQLSRRHTADCILRDHNAGMSSVWHHMMKARRFKAISAVMTDV
jgi:hypothetical protein